MQHCICNTRATRPGDREWPVTDATRSIFCHQLIHTVIICWLCFAFTLISFVLAALTSRHIQKYGPESTLVGGTSSTEHAHAHDHSHSLHHSTKEAKTSNDHVAA